MVLPVILTVVLAVSVSVVDAVPLARRASVCNGHAEFCDRSYGNITFIGAHDSYAFSFDPLALAADQQIDVPTQLEMGVRLLQAQSHMKDGELHFCHTDCRLFDGGTVSDYLGKVKTFLDANPNEVLTLLFTNPEGVSVNGIWAPVFNDSGIAQLAYVPPSIPVKQSDWPTLGGLIETGKRVIVFMDYNTNTTTVPYILPEFDMVWETPFDTTNSTFPCMVDRIGGPLAQSDHMNLLNHYLELEIFSITIPHRAAASRTNGNVSILANADACASLNGGRNPNFLLFDWVDVGDVVGAVAQLNMVNRADAKAASFLALGFAYFLLTAFHEIYAYLI